MSTDSDESHYHLMQRRMNRSPLTVYPDGLFRSVWDWLSVVVILTECIGVPMLLVFDKLNVEDGLSKDSVKVLAAGEVYFIIDMRKFFRCLIL